jgi:hypothetical protein
MLSIIYLFIVVLLYFCAVILVAAGVIAFFIHPASVAVEWFLVKLGVWPDIKNIETKDSKDTTKKRL